MESTGIKTAKRFLKKNKVGVLIHPEFRIYCKVTEIKAM